MLKHRKGYPLRCFFLGIAFFMYAMRNFLSCQVFACLLSLLIYALPLWAQVPVADAPAFKTEHEALLYLQSLKDKMFEAEGRQDLAGAERYAKALVSAATLNNHDSYLGDGICVLAHVSHRRGDYVKGLELYADALAYYKRSGEVEGIVSCYNNMASFFFRNKEHEKALEYYLMAHKTLEGAPLGKLDDLHSRQSMRSDVLLNVGECYYVLGQYQQAKSYEEQSLQIAQQYQLNLNIGYIYGTMALIEQAQGRSQHALRLFDQCLLIFEQEQDDYALADYMLKQVQLYQALGMKVQSFPKVHRALQLARSIGSPRLMRDAYGLLAQEHKQRGESEKALEALESYQALKDSLMSEEKALSIATIEGKLRLQDKQERIDDLQRDNAERLLQLLGLGGLLLLAGVSLLLLYSRNKTIRRLYRQIQRNSEEIASQNEDILRFSKEQASLLHQLGVQNKRMRDSITYALRIQQAILPAREQLSQVFSELTLFYQPRDIVSGDFYYFAQVRAEGCRYPLSFVAAVDCTGHGVPGAFMSLIGRQLLDEIILLKGVLRPDQILDSLHKSVRRLLQQQGGNHLQDGMELALCCLDPNQGQLLFSGARGGIYYRQGPEWALLPGSRRGVGGSYAEEQRPFELHCLDLTEGGMELYMFTDGYRDQFGGPQCKKFSQRQLLQLLSTLSDYPAREREQLLGDRLREWMLEGNEEQLDDILVLGGRLSI